MNIISKALLPLILTLSVNLSADDHLQDSPTFLPLEGFAWNYNSGKDMGDLQQLT